MKEVGNKFAFTLKVENFSNKAVKYDVKGNIQTDYAIQGQLGYSANVLKHRKLRTLRLKSIIKMQIRLPFLQKNRLHSK